MKPMPKGPMELPVGTKLQVRFSGEVYTLQTTAEWDGIRIGPCTLVSDTHSYSGEESTGDWPLAYEEPDYPWRILDSNENAVLWECVAKGDYYQTITKIGETPRSWSVANAKEYRAELGQYGWKINDSRECGGYVPRGAAPANIPKPPSPPPPPAPPSCSACICGMQEGSTFLQHTCHRAVPKWPTRSDRVAVLAAELSIPLADRIGRVKR